VQTNSTAEAVYLAGHAAPAGTYLQVDGNREVKLSEGGVLPGSCDGHVAMFRRRPERWGARRKTATIEKQALKD
jgi:hypothetical protein